MSSCFNNIYKDKRVLVTGATGFKGSWLSLWLHKLGAEVLGISLESKYSNDHFQVANLENKITSLVKDIRIYEDISKEINDFKPQFIFHLAAQALVGTSYIEPKSTFDTNVMGTLNILETLRNYSLPCTGIIITSDKCYKNIEQIWGYREEDILGGDDPYSASKGSAELVINSYMKSFFKEKDKNIASVRAGNVIGGGDRSEFRLVPDCFEALSQGNPVLLRNPDSTRPWQHVLDPLSGYLLLGTELAKGESKFQTSYNFGPSIDETHTVVEVAEKIIDIWGSGDLEIKSEENFYESSLLQLDCTKARLMLDWKPTLSFKETIKFTTEWYKYNFEKPDADMYSFGVDQIDAYEKLASINNCSWIK